MSRSLKAKFTIVFTATLSLILIMFSSALYGVVNQHRPGMIKERMYLIIEENPQLQMRGYYNDNDRNELLVQIGELLEAEQRANYNKLILILLVPTLLVSGALAYFIASYLVEPIEKLRKDVEKLNSKDIKRRLPERNASSEIEYLRESFNDLLDEVESAFVAQEEFIQDAAHELRTPLASIKAHLELIKNSDYKSKKDLINATHTLTEMNHKLISLSEDLLFLDRRNRVKPKNVKITELLDDVLELLNPQIKEKNIKIIRKYEFLGEAKVDVSAMSRVFENILGNSIKYSQNNPKIKIHVYSDREYIYMIVKDNGVGIPAKDQKRVFDRFYRGDPSASVDGSGLGLAIVKKIVEDHKGKVSLKSHMNAGTTIRLQLPR